jgi:TetR/AcrR family transcriptional regulator, transcriptional repressor for nem operon
MTPRPISKRDALIAATKDLLWERGFEAMSPRDVLDHAGAGQGSLYHHFKGKLDLSCAALREMAEEELAQISTMFDPSLPPLARISQYLARERQVLKGCRIARICNETAIREPEIQRIVTGFLGEIENKLHMAVLEAQSAGDYETELDASDVATALLSTVEGGYILARAHWDETRMRTAIAGVQSLFAMGIRNSAAHEG